MPLPDGTKLGPYEILAPLGAGGMGEVYRARDPRLNRDVAIKVLPEHLSKDPQALARFKREAQAVAALTHSNILAIYDVGTEQGVTYAVTELLEGETLRSHLRRGSLPWARAVEIGLAVAEGLAVAHSKGIVHRDLKPENIFLTEEGRPKILDFGLARWRPPKEQHDPAVVPTETEPGMVMGTVGYMSPEQIKGEAAEPASDIFSLGCVLYEMLAGKRAFSRETAAQTMAAILEHQPPSLLRAGIPAELDRLVMRCLNKNPAERFQSSRDLAASMKEVPVDGKPRAAASRRLPTAAMVGAAVFVLIAAGAGLYWFKRPVKTADSIAILPFENASGNPDMEYLSDGITESLINSLARIPNLQVMSRNSVFRFKKSKADAQTAGQSLNVKAVVTGRVVQRGDSLSISAELIDVRSNRQLWGENYNRTPRDILAVQEEISTEISDRLRFTLTTEERKRVIKRYTENTEAYQLYLKGRYQWLKKTESSFNKAIEYFQQAIDRDPKYAPAYAGLAACYTNMANYTFALLPPKEAWAKAKTAAEKALEIDDNLASAHASLAMIAYQWSWDWPEAEREFKRALELDPSSSSTYEPSPSSTNHWYSHYLLTVGRTQESFRAGQRALELDPLDLANNSHQGWHYVFTRQYSRAIAPLLTTIEMGPNFLPGHWYLGVAYEQQKAFPDALTQFQSCVRITTGLPSMTALVGHTYAVANRKSEAEAVLATLGALSKQRYVASYPVAAIYAGLGRNDEAVAWLERAFDERDSWMDYLGLDPRLDNLRRDARFTDLLHRMNLPQQEGGAH